MTNKQKRTPKKKRKTPKKKKAKPSAPTASVVKKLSEWLKT
jgi:hypothetical protein